MSIHRIIVIAINVFREVFRDRILYITALFGGLLLLGVTLLTEVSGGTENKITLDLGMAGIGLFGLVVAVFIGTGLINKEIEKRTVLALIAKPLSRSELVIGKHLGLSSVLVVLVGLMTVMFFVIMSLRQFQYPVGSLLISVGYLLLELSLITAAAILFGSFTSSLVATMLSFAVYLMGHFSQNLVTLSKTIKNLGVQQLVQGVYLVFPDLSRLDLKNDAVYGILPGPAVLLENAGYGVLYTILLLSISSWIFSRREF